MNYQPTLSASRNVCDHTSVGILVHRSGKLLLIDRRKPPYGFAPPAGHVDDRPNFEAAAAAELLEEVGLRATNLILVAEGRKENNCRRPGGTWHFWKIYRATADGRVKPLPVEVKGFLWCSRDKLQAFAERTRQFNSGQVSLEDWNLNPGLEPVWLEWLETTGHLDR